MSVSVYQLFVKLVFEIAVDWQTRTRDQIFEGATDPNHPPVPAVQPHPYLVNFLPNYAKSPHHSQNPNFGRFIKIGQKNG